MGLHTFLASQALEPHYCVMIESTRTRVADTRIASLPGVAGARARIASLPIAAAARARIASLLSAVVAAIAVLACDDPYAAFLRNVPTTPSEVTLYDYATSRLEDPPAFDIVGGRSARIDQTLNWDFLFQISDGTPELAPFSAATDTVTDAGLQASSESFGAILEAPETGYTIAEPVPVQAGDVLIARSRVDRTRVVVCNQYAKIEIIRVDMAAGTITFSYLINPNCGDTVLEAGQRGSL